MIDSCYGIFTVCKRAVLKLVEKSGIEIKFFPWINVKVSIWTLQIEPFKIESFRTLQYELSREKYVPKVHCAFLTELVEQHYTHLKFLVHELKAKRCLFANTQQLLYIYKKNYIAKTYREITLLSWNNFVKLISRFNNKAIKDKSMTLQISNDKNNVTLEAV